MDTKDEVSAAQNERKDGSSPSSALAHLDAIRPEDTPVRLGWRSWMVVFITSFVIMTQVFVVTAAGSVIAFIVRDLGEAGIAGWVIQVCQGSIMALGI